ncbi:cysteinyl-tRNA synthetase [Chitinophaga costaii]|uniref:Cysteine--tRNA ligase n=1 Tax=Chitinophaga costaii TaxID=1335309 RepID=A0A1C4ABF6_9BACT|nr:cysteine--tRNA ligase [Chitinophaga costaii]PUZ26539.1 cysteine--tRNA ligase [Chitinophaga costaii]SCB91926.1 cysteinyl-tRNA synthetase [Chitinophaga costaii]
MSALKVYNSIKRQKEEFIPIFPGHVGMYVCGPTVSGESHLGHARPYITFDVVFRYLTHLGYRVRYVRNITDAGHFEEEGRAAVDKIANGALLEKLEPMELVQKYTNLFHWAMQQFNCLNPSIEPTATGHITEQIAMIKQIMEAGYAYEVNGSVYFDVKKYAAGYNYGILSGRVLEDMLESTRELEGQDEKHAKVDFALWKNAPVEHLMRWPSPWGEGFPGWHIECSAMSRKYLGSQFDIHGGGMDLQFPHHECEIAQSEIAGGELMARYWMHNNMITINGRKMGKAYNNTIKLTEMFAGTNPQLEKPYSPMTIRFFVLQTHYRSTLDFSNEALQAAEKGLARLLAAHETLQSLTYLPGEGLYNEELDKQVTTWCQECPEFMNDDVNTAKVMANLFELTPIINSLKSGQIKMAEISEETFILLKTTWQLYLVDILGIVSEKLNDDNKLNNVLQLLMSMRKEAKARKDYATSDKIRNQLLEMGIQLKDEKDGSMSYSIV